MLQRERECLFAVFLSHSRSHSDAVSRSVADGARVLHRMFAIVDHHLPSGSGGGSLGKGTPTSGRHVVVHFVQIPGVSNQCAIPAEDRTSAMKEGNCECMYVCVYVCLCLCMGSRDCAYD